MSKRLPITTMLALGLLTICSLYSNTLGQVPPKANLYYFVVDRSGSIKTHKLTEPIREAIQDLIADLPSETEVRIQLFNQSADPPKIWPSMDNAAKFSLYRYLEEKFDPKGGTRLYDTVAEVINRVRAEHKTYGQINVIILSDGDDTKSRSYKNWDDLEPLAGKLKESQENTFISWYTLGFIPDDPPRPGGPVDVVSVDKPQVGIPLQIRAPQAEFSARPRKAKVGEQIIFGNRSVGLIDSHQWFFGDGSPGSTDISPEHKFQRKGTYDISLQVTGKGGTDKEIKREFIEIGTVVLLVADFSWSPVILRAGAKVRLIDESLGSPTRWHWQVQGKDPIEERNPSVVFSEPGRFSITLRISKDGKEHVVDKSLEVIPPRPDPSFTAQPTELEVSQVLHLKALGTGKGWEHTWTIAGDVILHGSEVSWEADRDGRIEILHQVESAGGVSVDDEVIYVKKAAKPLIPIAIFKVRPRSGRIPLEVRFTDMSKGEIVSYLWDFGDGTTSDLRDPVHTYEKTGSYIPRLIVKNTEDQEGKSPGDVVVKVKPPLPRWIAIVVLIILAILAWILVVVPFLLKPNMLPHPKAALQGVNRHYLRQIATKNSNIFWPCNKVTVGSDRKCDIRIQGSAEKNKTFARISRIFASDRYVLHPQNKAQIQELPKIDTSSEAQTSNVRQIEKSKNLRDGDRYLIGNEEFVWEQKTRRTK